MQTFLGCSVLIACLFEESAACTSGCNSACYNMGAHCCSQDGTTCHCQPIGVSCGAGPVNISKAVKLVKDEEVSAPTCTSGCNSACYNMGEHCCSEDGTTCHCRPTGVSCAAKPSNESLVQAVEKLSAPTCTSGCNSACYNMGEHCCSQSGTTCTCKPTGVACDAAPVNVSKVIELVKDDELEAPTCTSGCNSACYNMGEHCCSEDGTTCHCKPTGVSCSAKPDNKFEELMVKKVSAPACTSGCNSACYNMGEHCCGQDGSTCTCRPMGVSCASEPVKSEKPVVSEELSLPTCTSGCNSACYNMGEHCCSEDGTTCHCKPTGVSCGSGPSNSSRVIHLVKEGSADAFMTV